MFYYDNYDREENKEYVLGALTYGFYLAYGSRLF